MTENPFKGVKNIDAEFMERWLGGAKIESLSPKTLFDIQQLVQHYASIIVPDKKVKITFPDGEKECPRASVENLEVKIPTSLLGEGRVDDTIGAMIHELHHIKLSDKELNIWLSCFNFVCEALDTLFVEDGNGGYNSLYSLVMGDSTLSFEDIMDSGSENPNAKFIRAACDDIAFFLNAVEDIRIDANTPDNLKKYIDKMHDKVFEKYKPMYDSGEAVDNDDLFSIIYRLLFHHKGYIEDEYIKGKSPDTNTIVTSTAKENYAEFFNRFSEDLRKHIENLYTKEKGKPYLSGKPQVGQGRDIMDMYLSENSKEALKDLVNSQMEGDGDFLQKNIQFEDREFDGNNTKVASTLKEFSGEIEASRKKPIIIPKDFEMEIQSYKNIRVHNTTENLSDAKDLKTTHQRAQNPGGVTSVNYSCVFYDNT